MIQALLLTHRRNAAVALWRPSFFPGGFSLSAGVARLLAAENVSRENNSAKGECGSGSESLGLPHMELDAIENRCADNVSFRSERMLVLQNESILVAFGKEQTAEVLSHLYSHSLAIFGARQNDVQELFMGVGPGSFTGLRLGCAFANGLLLASQMLPRDCGVQATICGGVQENNKPLTKGFALPCWYPTGALLGAAIFSGSFARHAVELVSEDAYFSSPVDCWNVLTSIVAFEAGEGKEVSEFLPAYGREPGPVLKLQAAEKKERIE